MTYSFSLSMLLPERSSTFVVSSSFIISVTLFALDFTGTVQCVHPRLLYLKPFLDRYSGFMGTRSCFM